MVDGVFYAISSRECKLDYNNNEEKKKTISEMHLFVYLRNVSFFLSFWHAQPFEDNSKCYQQCCATHV